EKNANRTRRMSEYEMIDTGLWNEDRYFDIFIEYAKADPNDTLIRIRATNRGPEAAPLHILPSIWFRNTWSWAPGAIKPQLKRLDASNIGVEDPSLGSMRLWLEGEPPMLFTENDTNTQRLFQSP